MDATLTNGRVIYALLFKLQRMDATCYTHPDLQWTETYIMIRDKKDKYILKEAFEHSL